MNTTTTTTGRVRAGQVTTAELVPAGAVIETPSGAICVVVATGAAPGHVRAMDTTAPGWGTDVPADSLVLVVSVPAPSDTFHGEVPEMCRRCRAVTDETPTGDPLDARCPCCGTCWGATLPVAWVLA